MGDEGHGGKRGVSATLKSLLHLIEDAPEGRRVCALFDFDGTIISGYSAIPFIREQLRRGDLSPRDLMELATALTHFGLGKLGFSAMMAVTAQFLRGVEEQTYMALGETLFRQQIARRIYPESRALIKAHRAKGHTLAIISSATPYQVEAAAADLGIDTVLCTRLEVEDGRFTGHVTRPTCFGQGKVDAAQALADTLGAELSQSFFYSDSTDDRLLLERVGHPIALNPSDKLRALARDRHWPAVRFASRGRPTPGQFIRSVAATVSLVPAFAAGLPIYALTGSRREATNFSIALFADTASALINLDLKVRGEDNLWKSRPAVFVFNHQSKADVVICAKLLRRDMAGVGKREIKRLPVIGKVLELGGVVMIDRKNAVSAIQAMQPLVDALRSEGKSVALAPEGTRSVSPNLAPFKKGAFYLAIQARVPMVPVVIHNAGDVAPKGDFVLRPATVEVDVLPPVDTGDWSARTINDHVREVRNLFLKTLGQAEEAPPAGQAPTRARKDQAARQGGRAGAKAKTRRARPTRSTAGAEANTKTKAKAKIKATAKSGKAPPRPPPAKAGTSKSQRKTPRREAKPNNKPKSP